MALAPVAKAHAWLGGSGALLATYASLLIVLSASVAALGADVKKFAIAFTVVWVVGSYAHVAAVTPAEQQKFGISWSLELTNEGGFVVALLCGLVIANFFPRFAECLREAARALHQDRDRDPGRDRRGHCRRPPQASAAFASGISICGIAAAIATGGAIRARPAVPVLVCALVVVFAVVESGEECNRLTRNGLFN